MQSVGVANCCICQGGCPATEAWCTLCPCGHVFHQGCVYEALKHAKRCPICREPVKQKIRIFLETKHDTDGASADEVETALAALEAEKNTAEQQLQQERSVSKQLSLEVQDLLQQLQQSSNTCSELKQKATHARNKLDHCRQHSKQQQQQYNEQIATLTGKVRELSDHLTQKQSYITKQQQDISRLNRQLGLSRVCQEPGLSAQQLQDLLGPELEVDGGEYHQLVAALVKRTDDLQTARAQASQLEAELSAAREQASLTLASEQRRQQQEVEVLRKEVQQAKQERNQAEYQRDTLRDQLEAVAGSAGGQQQGVAAAGQQQQGPGPGRQHHAAAAHALRGDNAWPLTPAEEQQQPCTSSLPEGAAAAQRPGQQGPSHSQHSGSSQGHDELDEDVAAALYAADCADEAGAQLPGISRPGQLAKPLARPRFAGKTGVAEPFMGVGGFSRGSLLRQGPDGKGGQAKALLPITNTAKRAAAGAFVSSSGAAKKTKQAKFGAAAGTASIQRFFGRAQ